MTRKQKIRLITIVLSIVLLIFTAERIYNSRDEFQVTAMDASHYGIIEANLTTKEKLQDFEYLYDTLEKNYPFFKVNERLDGIDWLGNKSKYKRMIRNTKNDAEFYVAMDKIIRELNDGHTNIFDGKGFRRFYNYYYYKWVYTPYWDNIVFNPFVMHRYGFDGKIDSIELSTDSVLETKILIEDKLAYMKIKAMGHPEIMKGDYPKIKEFLMGVEDYEKLIIDIRGNGGGFDTYWKSIMELLIDEPLSFRYYVFFKDGHRNNNDPYKVKYLTTINSAKEELLGQFPKEIREDFDFYKSYFIRLNPWGVSANPSEYIDFKGKVYLLVDKDVFSSAENFASFTKDTGFATLVGEATGGGKGYEWLPITYLPKSKFAIRYSREMIMNADGTINMETKTTPHIQVDPTPHEDFNKDECIQAVIRDNGD